MDQNHVLDTGLRGGLRRGGFQSPTRKHSGEHGNHVKILHDISPVSSIDETIPSSTALALSRRYRSQRAQNCTNLTGLQDSLEKIAATDNATGDLPLF
jgi:hypothetical protein